MATAQLLNNCDMPLCCHLSRIRVPDRHEDSTYYASDDNDNDNTDEPLIHNEDVSNSEINKNNIAFENNSDIDLQHDVIAGVRG